MLFRADSAGTLGALRDTPGGGKVAPAVIARVGILTYQTPAGPVREYTPPDVLQAVVDALKDAPVTNTHPPVTASPQGPIVTPENASRYRHGHVSGGIAFDGQKLTADLAIDTAELLAAVARGRREVSLGYLREIELRPGLTPEGAPYDVIRTRIVPNHVAIVDTARAGREVCLKLDSQGNQILDTEDSMTLEQAQARIAELETQLKTKTDAADAVAKLQPKLDAAEARADAAEGKVAKLEAQVVELADPVKLDAAVAARVVLIQQAAKICGAEFKADGKSEEQIVREVAEKAHPAIQLDGKSADYVRGLFDHAVADAAKDTDGRKAIGRAASAPETKTDAAPAAAPHTLPLAVSK